MYQNAFDTDVMDDLFYDEAEGPAQMRYRTAAFDEFDDGFDEFDDFDAYDEMDAADAMEEAIADALAAEDTDEFIRRFRQAVNVARRIGRGVGQVARVVAPVARLIPHPAAQAIGQVASVAGRLLFEGADDFEALDELVDLADEEDVIDAAAPAAAGLAIHGVMPQQAARLPRPARQQLVRATTQAARTMARQQGPQTVRALPAVVQTAQRAARQQGLPPRAIPMIIRRLGARIARNPQLLRRLLQTASPTLRRSICAACGNTPRRPTIARRPMR
jgi:hypothetical protein